MLVFFSHLWAYLWAVFARWGWLVTVILFGIDKALEWAWPGYRTWLNETFPLPTRRKFFWRILFAFIFISGFLAWRGEYERAEDLAKQIRALETSPLQSQLTAANAEVARLNAESVRLQKKVEPYTLSKEQEDELFKELYAMSQKSTVHISFERHSEHAASFAKILHRVFVVAGWKVPFDPEQVHHPEEPPARIVIKTKGNPVPDGASRLQEFLKRHDIATFVDPQSGISDPFDFGLYVGRAS